jgi:hypothetical protein
MLITDVCHNGESEGIGKPQPCDTISAVPGRAGSPKNVGSWTKWSAIELHNHQLRYSH